MPGFNYGSTPQSARARVRIYGQDYKNRLELAGFTVKLDNYSRELGDNIIKKYGLTKNETIYFCSKPKLARGEII